MLEKLLLGKNSREKYFREVNVMTKDTNQQKEASSKKDKSVEQGELNKLSEQEKEELKVKDGQNNHHVNESGGF